MRTITSCVRATSTLRVHPCGLRSTFPTKLRRRTSARRLLQVWQPPHSGTRRRYLLRRSESSVITSAPSHGPKDANPTYWGGCVHPSSRAGRRFLLSRWRSSNSTKTNSDSPTSNRVPSAHAYDMVSRPRGYRRHMLRPASLQLGYLHRARANSVPHSSGAGTITAFGARRAAHSGGTPRIIAARGRGAIVCAIIEPYASDAHRVYPERASPHRLGRGVTRLRHRTGGASHRRLHRALVGKSRRTARGTSA